MYACADISAGANADDKIEIRGEFSKYETKMLAALLNCNLRPVGMRIISVVGYHPEAHSYMR